MVEFKTTPDQATAICQLVKLITLTDLMSHRAIRLNYQCATTR